MCLLHDATGHTGAQDARPGWEPRRVKEDFLFIFLLYRIREHSILQICGDSNLAAEPQIELIEMRNSRVAATSPRKSC